MKLSISNPFWFIGLGVPQMWSKDCSYAFDFQDYIFCVISIIKNQLPFISMDFVISKTHCAAH